MLQWTEDEAVTTVLRIETGECSALGRTATSTPLWLMKHHGERVLWSVVFRTMVGSSVVLMDLQQLQSGAQDQVRRLGMDIP